jgi:hypothetical protein
MRFRLAVSFQPPNRKLTAELLQQIEANLKPDDWRKRKRVQPRTEAVEGADGAVVDGAVASQAIQALQAVHAEAAVAAAYPGLAAPPLVTTHAAAGAYPVPVAPSMAPAQPEIDPVLVAQSAEVAHPVESAEVAHPVESVEVAHPAEVVEVVKAVEAAAPLEAAHPVEVVQSAEAVHSEA